MADARARHLHLLHLLSHGQSEHTPAWIWRSQVVINELKEQKRSWRVLLVTQRWTAPLAAQLAEYAIRLLRRLDEQVRQLRLLEGTRELTLLVLLLRIRFTFIILLPRLLQHKRIDGHLHLLSSEQAIDHLRVLRGVVFVHLKDQYA